MKPKTSFVDFLKSCVLSKKMWTSWQTHILLSAVNCCFLVRWISNEVQVERVWQCIDGCEVLSSCLQERMHSISNSAFPKCPCLHHLLRQDWDLQKELVYFSNFCRVS